MKTMTDAQKNAIETQIMNAYPNAIKTLNKAFAPIVPVLCSCCAK